MAATAKGSAGKSAPRKMHGRHFLNLGDLEEGGLQALVAAAIARKKARAGLPHGGPDRDAPLAGHALASIFEKPSTRTRISFDIAMRQLGGHTLTLSASDMQLGRGETVEDTAQVLSRFVDVVMIRANRHSDLRVFAANATVPLINGLSDLSHPCQIVADLMTVAEHAGSVEALPDLTWAWLGDGNNVCNSVIEAAGLLGFSIRVATPAIYQPNEKFVTDARARGANVVLTEDPAEAAEGADVVVTDTWVSMGQADTGGRKAALTPYQVNRATMELAAQDALFLHCLPAHRGEEVSANIIDGPQSVVFDEAENRVHGQKAVLLWALGKLSCDGFS